MAYTTQLSKLKRARNQRRALLRLLASNLILKKKIHTTETKAKAVRPFLERLVTAARKDTVASRRRVARFLPSHSVRALHELAAAYKNRPGGYVRIIKTAPRRRDNAKMAFIEFVQ